MCAYRLPCDVGVLILGVPNNTCALGREFTHTHNIYMCVYIGINIHIHMCMYVCVCVYIYVHVFMCVYTHVYMYV